MKFTADKLFELLPAIYRIRDAEQGGPLKDLISVLTSQINELEDDLARLYDDQFIETCTPWVVPYIGDLIGIRGLQGSNVPLLSERAEVAHTIAYRRRKGTAAMLEQLARDVTGLPARAVEFFQVLATTQHMNHIRAANRSFVSVRDADRLQYIETHFEHLNGQADLTHTVDVRNIASGRGKYNIPNVGVFLWRQNAYSLTRSPAVDVDGNGRRFFFDPLGVNTELFIEPETEEEITHLAEPINVPMPISRRMMKNNVLQYYGNDKSILIESAGADVSEEPAERPVAGIRVCDLRDTTGADGVVTWANLPAETDGDILAIDPELGRMAFSRKQDRNVLVTYHRGFSANMGGGEYRRSDSFDRSLKTVHKVASIYVSPDSMPKPYSTIQDAMDALGSQCGVVEICDSGRYEWPGSTVTAEGSRIELRAAETHRPTIVLDQQMNINGDDDGEVTLNGLLICGAGLTVTGVRKLRLLHCTILSTDTSIEIKSPNTMLEIDRCIVGALRTVSDARVQIRNSIVDAGGEKNVAYANVDDKVKEGSPVQIENCTIIGNVRTTIMELASNTIFLAKNDDPKVSPVSVQQQQKGCVRFSYLPDGAVVPRRYHCMPEVAGQTSVVHPAFTSLAYGDPGYCQLNSSCPPEIFRGADDGAEMGAFHDLYEPQRTDRLRNRLEEYLRFGLEAGIFYAT